MTTNESTGTFLQRINFRPNMDALNDRQRHYLQRHFDYSSTTVTVHNTPMGWEVIEEVEVVPAARVSGAAGWLTRRLIGSDRYHVGIYYGRREAVLANISLGMAKYVVQVIAYHAPQPVRYKGPETLVALTRE